MDQGMFCEGLTFDEYVSKMTPAHQDGFLKSCRLVRLSEEDKNDLSRLRYSFFIVAFTEAWCGDCRINLPVVASLAAASTHLELRCFSREEHPQLADKFWIERIPTFVILNEEFEEIARWIERPSAVAEALEKGNEEEKRFVRVAYNQGRYQPDTIDEILDLLLA